VPSLTMPALRAKPLPLSSPVLTVLFGPVGAGPCEADNALFGMFFGADLE
jgi:hypothetical protein